MSAGAVVAIVLGSVFGVLVLIGMAGALVGSAPDDGAAPQRRTPPTAPAPEKTAAPSGEPEVAQDAPVRVTAKKTPFTPGVLHDGGTYTSVSVTVTNNGGKPIGINPLYFSITDTVGGKHTAELGVDDQQMDTVDLAPGENITGVITGKGSFTPRYVTYVEGLFGDGVRGNVT
ncbi:DUF4352 domain-containing protein [Streptomyces sp. NRRL S-118]|uniref:DUF4352 domain-containing protein n=1 Tax=Streptomyces sp. NRRL S-118 TaxID=1463881 RepID=UPI000694DE4C|nr:DUF4352 domain-containing protein [Streptomyces sp. NRRL S-118]